MPHESGLQPIAVPVEGLTPGMCLHCEEAPAATPLGLCAACGAQRAVRMLYVRKRGWTPEFEAHLMRLRRRAEQKRPLFDGPLVVGAPRNGRIHPLRTFEPERDDE